MLFPLTAHPTHEMSKFEVTESIISLILQKLSGTNKKNEKVQKDLKTYSRRINPNYPSIGERLVCVVVGCESIKDIQAGDVTGVNTFKALHERAIPHNIDIGDIVAGGYSVFSKVVLAESTSEDNSELFSIFRELAQLLSIHYGSYQSDRYYWVDTDVEITNVGFDSFSGLDLINRKQVVVERLLSAHSNQIDSLQDKGYKIVGGEVISNNINSWLVSESKIISAGGYGCVYRANSNEHKVDVAMKLSKIPDSDCKYGLAQEAERLRELEQSNCRRFAPLLEEIFLEDEEATVLILPWYSRGSLGKYCSNQPGRRLPAWQAVVYFRQLLEALDWLSERDIIHRDIKPDNLLIEDNLSGVVLIDFGLCRNETINSTATVAVGTKYFLAPEVECETDYGTLVDCYSAGVTLFNILTGELPTPEGVITDSHVYRLLVRSLVEFSGLSEVDAKAVILIIQGTLCKDKRCRNSAAYMLKDPTCDVYDVIRKAKFDAAALVKNEQKSLQSSRSVVDPVSAVVDKKEDSFYQPSNEKAPRKPTRSWFGSVVDTLFPGPDQRSILVDKNLHDSCGGVDTDAFA